MNKLNRETVTVGEISGVFKLHFHLDNDAFQEDTCLAIASTLMKVAARISQMSSPIALSKYLNITDINGNIVGQLAIKPTLKD